MRRTRRLVVGDAVWEAVLLAFLILAVVAAARLSPFYLNVDQILYSMQQAIGVVGLLAAAFMLVIVQGHIDISLPAIMAIGTVSLARLSAAGLPLAVALPLVVALGAGAGFVNGFLVARFDVPAMAVTLGTNSIYRAVALAVGGIGGYAADVFRPSYIWLGSHLFAGRVPASLILLLLVFAVMAVVMHRSVFGRLLYTVGLNRRVVYCSGYNVKAITIIAYTAAGSLAAIAALVFVGQYESARADNGSAMLLFVVACVVLGGFDAAGGRGTVAGLLLSLLFVGTLHNGMGLANVPGPTQTLVVGIVLILAVAIPPAVRGLLDASAGRRLLSSDVAAGTTDATADRVGVAIASYGSPGPDPAADSDRPPHIASHGGPMRARGNTSAPELQDSYDMTADGDRNGGAYRLAFRGVSKAYGGIRALRDVSFDVEAGRIHAVVGENGAGKSTLVKIITGMVRPDAGVILIDGTRTEFSSPGSAREHGVVAVYQDPKLFPNLDIAENIFMGVHPVRRLLVDRRAMYEQSRSILHRLGVSLDPRRLVASLSPAHMQFVEFARALARGRERVVILDEPTAPLSPEETERLFTIVRRMRDEGAAIVIISHRLEELEGFVDTVTVLRDGRHVITRPKEELGRTTIVHHMVGGALDEDSAVRAERTLPAIAPILDVRNLSKNGYFRDVNFSVRPGEVVTLAGIVGAGRTEIAQAIAGIEAADSGEIRVDGEPVGEVRVPTMLARGVAYLPENREGEGLVGTLSVARNISLPRLADLARLALIDLDRERASAQKYIDMLSIKAPGPTVPISSLSGGNRQKVVLAKWLAIEPRVLILDEPTHGIDVGSKVHVHEMVARLASDGMAIVIVSSDLSEVMRVSDRVIVIRDGRIAAELTRNELSRERIMTAATMS